MISRQSFRKSWVAVLAGLTVTSWLIADSQSSDAQLFQRIRQRIQSRVPPLPTNPNPNGARPSPFRQPAAQDETAKDRSDASDGANGVRARKVAPVNPTPSREAGEPTRSSAPQLAPSPSRRPTQPGQSSQSGRSTQGGGTAAASPADEGDLYGASILPGNGPTADPELDAAKPSRASLGIQVVKARQGAPGLVVTAINPGSYAPAAGLQVGDLVVSVDGQPIDSVAKISELLAVSRNTPEARVGIVRDGQPSSLAIPLIDPTPMNTAQAAAETEAARPTLNRVPDNDIAVQSAPAVSVPTPFGMRASNVDGQRGALVTKLDEHSPAANSGLRTGDRIVAIDGRLVVNASGLQEALRQSDPSATLDLRLVRDGKLLSTTLDPNAEAKRADAVAGDNGAQTGPKSVLGGVGAIFGELLGNKPKPKSADEMALGDDDGVQQVDFQQEVQSDPNPSQDPVSNDPVSNDPVSNDPVSTDPLALEAIEPPANAERDSSALLPPQPEKSAAELQAEIEALKEQIRALKEKE